MLNKNFRPLLMTNLIIIFLYIKHYKFFKYKFFKMLCYKNIVNSYVKYSRNTENVFKSFIIWHHEVQ